MGSEPKRQRTVRQQCCVVARRNTAAWWSRGDLSERRFPDSHLCASRVPADSNRCLDGRRDLRVVPELSSETSEVRCAGSFAIGIRATADRAGASAGAVRFRLCTGGPGSVSGRTCYPTDLHDCRGEQLIHPTAVPLSAQGLSGRPVRR